jgi:hypothetical protein
MLISPLQNKFFSKMPKPIVPVTSDTIIVSSQSALSARIGFRTKDGKYLVLQCPIVCFSSEQIQEMNTKGLIKDLSVLGSTALEVETFQEANIIVPGPTD